MGSPSSDQDRARFQSVVMPHLADAYALARWLTGDRTDAEDVVQEACLRAFRGIGGFAGVNARAWLLTIVRHAAYTWLGKNRSASLPVPFRETLVLRDVQGLDYREIAEVTKVPIGTVMSRLARARRRLIASIGTDKPGGAP